MIPLLLRVIELGQCPNGVPFSNSHATGKKNKNQNSSNRNLSARIALAAPSFNGLSRWRGKKTHRPRSVQRVRENP